MKKLALGALAAIVATVSLSTVAEAGWRHNNWRHNGWNHNRFWGPRIVIRPVIYNDYCFVKKVKHVDDWGNVYVDHVRVCG